MAAIIRNTTEQRQRDNDLEDVQVVSRDEARRTFDQVAQHYLAISGSEFLRRWDAGQYADCADQFPIRRVATLRHLAR